MIGFVFIVLVWCIVSAVVRAQSNPYRDRVKQLGCGYSHGDVTCQHKVDGYDCYNRSVYFSHREHICQECIEVACGIR